MLDNMFSIHVSSAVVHYFFLNPVDSAIMHLQKSGPGMADLIL